MKDMTPPMENLILWYCELRADSVETFGHANAPEQTVQNLLDNMISKCVFEKTDKFEFKSEKSRELQDNSQEYQG